MPDLTPEEHKDRFDQIYQRNQNPAMQSSERCAFGCDYGATSWAVRDEADELIKLLELAPGVRLLDVGAGSGWPGLYMAQTSGCDVTLIDVPFSGLRIAAERAAKDNLPGTCWAAVADGANMPFGGAVFDAISHSDVLCCLVQKRAVLQNCRRVIRPDGRMVFSVIFVAPGLSATDYKRAIEASPPFVETDTEYPALLAETGWNILEERDVTAEFASVIQRQLKVDSEQRDGMEPVMGTEDYTGRLDSYGIKYKAVSERIVRRSLFITRPV
jgi:27-O-demethylrifamycin SV methyltransferase